MERSIFERLYQWYIEEIEMGDTRNTNDGIVEWHNHLSSNWVYQLATDWSLLLP